MADFRKTNEDFWLRYINISGDGNCRKQREKFFAEEANIPGNSLYAVG